MFLLAKDGSKVPLNKICYNIGFFKCVSDNSEFKSLGYCDLSEYHPTILQFFASYLEHILDPEYDWNNDIKHPNLEITIDIMDELFKLVDFVQIDYNEAEFMHLRIHY